MVWFLRYKGFGLIYLEKTEYTEAVIENCENDILNYQRNRVYNHFYR